MEKVYFAPESDGFYGVHYPNPRTARGDIDRKLTDAIQNW